MDILPVECVPSDGYFHFSVSVLVLFGIYAGYFPQILKLISRKTVDGLSALFLLLGAIGTNSILINAVLLQKTQLECCIYQPFGDCLKNVMSLIQLGSQFVLYNFILVLFYYFSTTKKGFFVMLFSICQICLLSFISIILLIKKQQIYIQYFAATLGFLTMIVSLVQYLPQIFLTFKDKRVGALSIISLSIQAPGSYIFVWSLANTPGTNVSTWITFLVSGTLQSVLLALCIIYHRREKYVSIVCDEEEQGFLSDSTK